MLYKFKSDAGADVIMLEANGRQLLEWMGRSPDPKGILLPEGMTAAKAAIESGLAVHERQLRELAQAADAEPAANDAVSLRARAWPLVTLIDQSLKAKVPIVWGV